MRANIWRRLAEPAWSPKKLSRYVPSGVKHATRASTSCRLNARSNSLTMLTAVLPLRARARRSHGLSGSCSCDSADDEAQAAMGVAQSRLRRRRDLRPREDEPQIARALGERHNLLPRVERDHDVFD